IRQKLKQYNNIPVYYMNYRPLNFQFLNSDLSHLKTIPLKQLESEEVLAVSGIGNPEGFIKTLKDLSLKVKDSLHFADHYQYGKDGINHIIDLCKKNKVDKVIITEKDGVKFTPEIMDTLDKAGIKIYCLKISVEINREREFFSHIKPIF
ncbi:MAG: tetraacyldisaccharide 4'-kinase, partial [Halanaerobiales bacterium]